MAMAPGPILLLLIGRNPAEVAILVIVILASPLVVVDGLVVVPHAVVAVIRIIDAVVMRVTASHDQRRRCQRGSEKTGTEKTRALAHRRVLHRRNVSAYGLSEGDGNCKRLLKLVAGERSPVAHDCA